ncbi:MAG: nucleotidyltransferase family protein [Alistipes senegalensis]|nr:nucleotidyltransferase family protein [Alistipes senegalensis]
MKQIGYDMLYLSACAVNKIKPDSDYIAHVNLDKLFQMCQYHSLTAIVCTALESAGIYNKKFMEEKAKAIRKIILLDAEREQICEFLEQNNIWYVPLKGVILKNMYPEIGMRQMSDNDILFDASHRIIVTDFMQKRGYHLKDDNGSHCDEWLKEPVYNFEMHLNLFVKSRKVFCNYYKNVRNRLIRTDGKKYAYRFSDEDFYIYMTAHTYKHYSGGGTGLRSLLDYYVYLKKKEALLDWKYITKELEKLDISEFEKELRITAKNAFTTDSELTEKEREIVEFMLFSGTYGNVYNTIKHKAELLNADSKSKYIFRRIFPNMRFYKQYFPTAARYPILIPFVWAYRLFNAVFKKRDNCLSEIKNVKKMSF